VPESDPERQRALVRALGRQLGARLIETHISFVLLAGGQAYKIKKALDLGFADLRLLAQRQALCHEELRLNRRSAPQLYERVLPVTGSARQPAVGGRGRPLEWLLRMRAFSQRGLWDRLAARGALQAWHIDALVETLCDFHARAQTTPAGSAYGRPAQLREPMLDNLRVLGELCREPAARAALARLVQWEAQNFRALRRVFAQRRADGRVRDAHGDLHLGNVTQHEGRTLIFDCLEFSPALRWTDVMSDVAFMAMDLQAHGLAPLAHRFVNAYVERSGDVQGLRVLRYYTVHRALVRAKVAALRAAQLPAASQAARAARRSLRHYLAQAVRSIEPVAPVLMLTHGFSGSGKTALTRSLLEACGAVRFRADVERKRLFGLPPLARPGAATQRRLYSAQADAATQSCLRAHAALALRSGYRVILDATFLQRGARRLARRLAERLGARFVIIDFQAAPQVLRARVARRLRRADDASDAGLAVLLQQQAQARPLTPDERAATFVFDAGLPADEAAMPARWAPLLRRIGAG